MHFLNGHHKVSLICISLKLLFFCILISFSNFYLPNKNLVIHIILIKGNNGTTIFLFYIVDIVLLSYILEFESHVW